MATVNPIFFLLLFSYARALVIRFAIRHYRLQYLQYSILFCVFKAARRNPSLPVKLLGYKPLVEAIAANPQSNSESLPDLKCANSPNKLPVAQQRATVLPPSDLAFGHSMSDPALVRTSSGRTSKSADSAGAKAMMPTSPLIERLRADGLNSSASDCSDQSGWVSSTMSSRQNSPPLTRHQLLDDEPPYPELEPVPLAPPEEFQVLR